MRVPVSWLGEFIPIDGVSTEQLDAAFVRQGLEVEAIHRSDITGPLVVGEVRQITELTEFKKSIRHCLVDVGEAEPRSIVCGATNFNDGDWVVVSLPGAVLPGGFAITSRQTYGYLSDGMICSARELGLGDDHTGIMVLDRGSLPESLAPGSDAISLLGLADVVFELAITPDRGYCLSMRGIAREISHALGVPFVDPGAMQTPPATAEPPYPVQIDDPVGCDRFVGRVVRGIDPTTPTPLWMKRRLLQSAVRSISFAVDVTNYLMLELGQPMHAFDLAKLTGPVVVRRAHPGEKLHTLDGVERILDPDDLLITDDTGPIGLAGVMGGSTTEISAETTDVLIECAHWEPAAVARRGRRHKITSEAAKRFERGVDPQMAPVAAARVVELLTSLAGGVADAHVLDFDAGRSVPTVRLPVSLPGRIAGVTYDPATVHKRLSEIGCAVEMQGDVVHVSPPSWRPDLQEPYDLVEEVVRLEGYDEIPSLLPTAPASPGLSGTARQRRNVARTLADAGYVEVLTYPFVSPSIHDRFGLADDDPRRQGLRLANPLSAEEPELRTSLLPGLLKTLQLNLGRGQHDVALFEIGLVYQAGMLSAPPPLSVDRRPTDEELAALFAAVPPQPHHVGVVLTGETLRSGWWGNGELTHWADAVAAGRLVAQAAGVSIEVSQSNQAPWHPGRCAEFRLAGAAEVIGYAGELHPRVVAALDLPERVCAMEINLAALPEPSEVTGPQLSTFPPALLDVALLVDSATPAAEVEHALTAGAGPLLETVRLFDVYTGAQLGEGRKSLAYSLTLRAPDRTLTVEEATAIRDAAVAEARSQVGAQLRS